MLVKIIVGIFMVGIITVVKMGEGVIDLMDGAFEKAKKLIKKEEDED